MGLYMHHLFIDKYILCVEEGCWAKEASSP